MTRLWMPAICLGPPFSNFFHLNLLSSVRIQSRLLLRSWPFAEGSIFYKGSNLLLRAWMWISKPQWTPQVPGVQEDGRWTSHFPREIDRLQDVMIKGDNIFPTHIKSIPQLEVPPLLTSPTLPPSNTKHHPFYGQHLENKRQPGIFPFSLGPVRKDPHSALWVWKLIIIPPDCSLSVCLWH